MELSALFWFYKDPAICENRLQLLQKHNPDMKVFGLYGGDRDNEEKFRNLLNPYLVDFYTSPFESSHYKWIKGDMVLLDWYNQRGRDLIWDSTAIIQWDMLVFDSLYAQFKDIKKDEIYLSGLHVLSKFIEYSWWWTTPLHKENRKDFTKFRQYIKEKFHYNDELFASQFIFEILPKSFFEKYSELENKELGMLEYKIPTLAKILNFSFYEKNLPVMGFGNGLRRAPFTALRPFNKPISISDLYIENELSKDEGWRLFHPYFKHWNI